MIEILTPGPLATVQDAGRPGYAALGVPRSGAFDRAAAALANRLVGNRPDAALLEVTLGGLEFVLHDAATLAVTGAPCDGPLGAGQAVSRGAGARVRLGAPPWGLRSYVAVRGGLDVAATLGSRATDTLSGLGPAPLRAGDRLRVGDADVAAVSDAVAPSSPPRGVLRVVPGPREDWFGDEGLGLLTGTVWTVRGESDRVGIRLDGARLPRRGGELPSEPTLPGALQVPPDGRPILFGPDAPTTGGYPVIAVVRDADLDQAAQLRPGDTVRFTR